MRKALTMLIAALSLLAAPSLFASGLQAPTALTAEWATGASDPNGRITLQWIGRATENTAYIIQRKICSNITSTATVINANWVNLAFIGSATATSYVDQLTTPLPNTLNAYFYRVRPVTGTGSSIIYGEPGEVVIIGNPSLARTQASARDTDADHIDDEIEISEGMDPNDWADGTGDKDGDGIPNAWEVSFNATANQYDLSNPDSTSTTITPSVIVDGSLPADNLTATPPRVRTISAALTAARLGTALNDVPPYRLIFIRPGVYNENVTIPSGYKIALIRKPESDADRREVVLRGVATTPAVPVLSTSGTFVLDGFVLGRAPGSRAPVISIGEIAEPNSRATLCRLVNCLVAGADTGVNPVVENYRCRLIISHCTFWMNNADPAALAHSYSPGLLSSGGVAVSPGTAVPGAPNTVMSHYLQTTSRLVIHNSVFWNPLPIFVPEIDTAIPQPDIAGAEEGFAPPSLILNHTSKPAEVGYGMSFSADPKLTPKGYIMGVLSGNVLNKAADVVSLRVPKDMHGALRANPNGRSNLTWLDAGSSVEVTGYDIGAQQWFDSDNDGLPDFDDREPFSAGNELTDWDYDGLTELQEYFSGTDIKQSDSTYLTLAQAQSLFSPLGSSSLLSSFYTKAETDTLFARKALLPDVYTKAQADSIFLRVDASQNIPEGTLEANYVTLVQGNHLFIDEAELQASLDIERVTSNAAFAPLVATQDALAALSANHLALEQGLDSVTVDVTALSTTLASDYVPKSVEQLALGQSAQAGAGGWAFGNSSNAGANGISLGASAGSAENSVALGHGASAAGIGAISLGHSNEAAGVESISAGAQSSASAAHAIALGRHVVASQWGQVVLGSYNLASTPANSPETATDLLIIGNGTADDQRSNGLVVKRSGDLEIGGGASIAGGLAVSGPMTAASASFGGV